MALNVNPLQPFELIGQNDLGKIYLQSLTQLYQPIIGPVSVSLYITMMSLPTNVNKDERVALRHQIFLVQCNMGIVELNQAREKLEAVGLIKTYRDMQSNRNPKHQTIQYHLSLPTVGYEFFQEPLLSTALLKQLGDEDYHELKKTYEPIGIDEERYAEESSTFQKVFYPIQIQEDRDSENVPQDDFFYSPGLDYGRFLNYVISEGINHSELTHELKKQVYAIFDVYGNSEGELASLVYQAMDKTTGKVDIDLLKKIADKQNSKETSSWQVPTSSIEDLSETNKTSRMFTNEEIKARREQIKAQYPNLVEEDIQLVLSCEQMPSHTFLDKTKEAKKTFATDSEHYYIKDLAQKSRLNEHVINFLIYYLLVINHRPNLYKGELERNASEWQQEELTNVPKAMEFIRLQKKKKEVQQKQHNKQTNYKRRKASPHKEVIPSWMKEKKNDNAPSVSREEATEPLVDVQDNEEELRRRLNELIGGEGEN